MILFSKIVKMNQCTWYNYLRQTSLISFEAGANSVKLLCKLCGYFIWSKWHFLNSFHKTTIVSNDDRVQRVKIIHFELIYFYLTFILISRHIQGALNYFDHVDQQKINCWTIRSGNPWFPFVTLPISKVNYEWPLCLCQ